MSRILVVEDDSSVRELLCAVLANAGFSTEAAADGVEALERLESEPFDLVLLDVWLPRLDGLAVIERLRHFEQVPRVIVVTGDETTETVFRALRAQACRYLTKPIFPEPLIELVREVLASEPAGPPIEVVSARPNWVELLMPCTLEAAERAQSFLDVLKVDLPPGVAESVGRAVHELILNAAEWGGQLDPGRRVRIACVRTPRLILYRIADPGPGFRFEALTHAALNNPLDSPAAHEQVRAEMGLRPGGFGILMTRSLVDELVYNEAQNEVILIKYLA
jgi:CheY-like chemotaxis protein/anti-sigma regulatory factor (Ser/Thr protein kinase)